MNERYVPNEVSLRARVIAALSALFLLAYGGYGLYANDLAIPDLSRRWWRRGIIHLHDEPAIIMFGALVCGALMLLSIIIDHYDRRNNEHHYQTLSVVLMYTGVGLFCAALIASLVQALIGIP